MSTSESASFLALTAPLSPSRPTLRRSAICRAASVPLRSSVAATGAEEFWAPTGLATSASEKTEIAAKTNLEDLATLGCHSSGENKADGRKHKPPAANAQPPGTAGLMHRSKPRSL